MRSFKMTGTESRVHGRFNLRLNWYGVPGVDLIILLLRLPTTLRAEGMARTATPRCLVPYGLGLPALDGRT
jgi:hypothetical protein